jgi:hypothetical protein
MMIMVEGRQIVSISSMIKIELNSAVASCLSLRYHLSNNKHYFNFSATKRCERIAHDTEEYINFMISIGQYNAQC